jgi:hypothetical protein
MDLSRAKSVPREPRPIFWSQAFHTGYYYQCEGLFELQCSHIVLSMALGFLRLMALTISVKQDA